MKEEPTLYRCEICGFKSYAINDIQQCLKRHKTPKQTTLLTMFI